MTVVDNRDTAVSEVAMTTNEVRWLTVREFLAENKGRISRNQIYELCKQQKIPYVKLGRLLIPSDLLERCAVGWPSGDVRGPGDSPAG